MKLNFMKQKGFTLIETMISMGLGLVIVAGVLMMFSSNLKAMNDTILKTKLVNELNSSLLVMSTMLRQSGYKYQSGLNGVIINNQFNTVTITGGDCILFSYDKSADGVQSVGEHFGFKLIDGAIKMKISGSNETDCAEGKWENLTSSDTKITMINFQMQGVDKRVIDDYVPMIQTRKVDIEIEAENAGNNTIKESLYQTIKLRNDLYKKKS